MSFSYNLAKFIAFQDAAECARVRAIKKEDITRHPNPDFKIGVIADLGELYAAFAADIVGRIKRAFEEIRTFVGIFPVGPMPQYAIAARMINELRIPMHHVHTFNMDEYADQDGNTAPADWPGSFQRAMMDNFFLKIDPDLRPPLRADSFPVDGHHKRLRQDAGGYGRSRLLLRWRWVVRAHRLLGSRPRQGVRRRPGSLSQGGPAPRRADAHDHHAECPAFVRRRLVMGAAEGCDDRAGANDGRPRPQLLARRVRGRRRELAALYRALVCARPRQHARSRLAAADRARHLHVLGASDLERRNPHGLIAP